MRVCTNARMHVRDTIVLHTRHINSVFTLTVLHSTNVRVKRYITSTLACREALGNYQLNMLGVHCVASRVYMRLKTELSCNVLVPNIKCFVMCVVL